MDKTEVLVGISIEGVMVDSLKDQKCELCGMVATSSVTDALGVTHYYCEHHAGSHVPETKESEISEHAEHMTAVTFDKHAGHSVNMFRDRFWLSLILTTPVLVYSNLPTMLFGISAPAFPGSDYLSIVLATIVFAYGGIVFLKGAAAEIEHRLPGMMTLIALAISVAYVYSVISQFILHGETLFWELTSLITIMLLGHWIEMKSVAGAQGALQELNQLLPDTAELVTGATVPVIELKVGNLVLVRPGGKIPADGTVNSGSSEVNESMVTGESKPIEKGINSKVIAGTVNGSGSLKIEVTKVGSDTALAGIMRLVAEAQASKSRLQILADRFAAYLTFVAVGSGAVTFVVWEALGQGLGFSIDRVVAVLVIACPHALGLAIPLVTSISTSLSAKNGLLVRDRMALEAARNIDVVLFDKTGTLTAGQFGVTGVFPVKDSGREQMVQLAAAVEAESEHVIGRGIVAYAKKLGINIPKVTNVKATPGKGVAGQVSGIEVSAGNAAYFKDVVLPEGLDNELERIEKEGATIVYVVADGILLGAIALEDLVRNESKEAVVNLKKMGLKVAMLTGDSEAVAAAVAAKLGIDQYFAKVLPENKVDKVKELQKDGSKVAMVGDGVNDAPALTQANLGIAIGAGTDVAIESAGIILVKNDPRDVVKIIKLSRATYSKMIQNLAWAAGYNVIAIPLAAGVLAGLGIVLAPAFGAILMSASTVIVAVNAQTLRGVKLT